MEWWWRVHIRLKPEMWRMAEVEQQLRKCSAGAALKTKPRGLPAAPAGAKPSAQRQYCGAWCGDGENVV
jgi:hypothetical protein